MTFVITLPLSLMIFDGVTNSEDFVEIICINAFPCFFHIIVTVIKVVLIIIFVVQCNKLLKLIPIVFVLRMI